MDERILFDEAILTLYCESLSVTKIPNTNNSKDKVLMVYEYEETRDIPEENPVDATGKAVLEKTLTDMLIHAQALLPRGEVMKYAAVKGRYRYPDGNIIGTLNDNTILNSTVYNV